MTQIAFSFNDQRAQSVHSWLQQILPDAEFSLSPAAVDGSARRYFRVFSTPFRRDETLYQQTSYIVMDAPPDVYPLQTFLAIGAALDKLGLHVPRVYAENLEQGFLLLADLGTRHYLDALQKNNADALYADALDALSRLQLGGDINNTLLPPYDRAFVLRELEIFREWYLQKYLQLNLSDTEQRVLEKTFALFADNALAQPQVWMHRDYHSRNLMIVDGNNPGIIDFQDAVIGPVTYDLVSLLRDCYIDWPQARVQTWALDYKKRLQALGFGGLEDDASFLRWFDLMGAQRHLKAAGIFARLHLRDGKNNFLQYIPRTLHYVVDVSARHSELSGLNRLLLSCTI